MFSTEFLHIVREYEINEICKYFTPGASILEIGGGTGYQAKQLAARGFEVCAIDVAASNYRNDRVFPVLEYDGNTFPFEDGIFDIVFSSNALEHFASLEQFHRESRRVLKPDGFCIHVMPSASWRLWTGIAGYIELVQRLFALLPALAPRSFCISELKRPAAGLLSMARVARAYAIPPRHGETGNAFTELWTFSRRHWIKHFHRHDCEVMGTKAMGLFYTGHMVLGKHWSFRSRRHVASVLGSACILYKVRPRHLS